MRFKGLLLVGIMLMLILSACASPESSPADGSPAATTTPGPLAQINQLGSFFAINEIGLGPDGFVALTNFTDIPVSLVGLYLCQGSDCFELPDEVVSPEETVRIAAGSGKGHENIIASGATFGELRPRDGEIALIKSKQIDDPGALLVYFQWGSNPHDLTHTAIEAGLWVEGGYGPSSDNATRLYKVAETGLWLFEEP